MKSILKREAFLRRLNAIAQANGDKELQGRTALLNLRIQPTVTHEDCCSVIHPCDTLAEFDR
jgi:hypothetical protein